MKVWPNCTKSRVWRKRLGIWCFWMSWVRASNSSWDGCGWLMILLSLSLLSRGGVVQLGLMDRLVWTDWRGDWKAGVMLDDDLFTLSAMLFILLAPSIILWLFCCPYSSSCYGCWLFSIVVFSSYYRCNSKLNTFKTSSCFYLLYWIFTNAV